MIINNKTEARSIIDKLTPKEFEVVSRITAGDTCKELCERLGIVEGTYRRHKINIKKKMGGRPVWGWPAILIAATPDEVRDEHEPVSVVR
jgi:DNA-binding CsgD family transcriptional regulator